MNQTVEDLIAEKKREKYEAGQGWAMVIGVVVVMFVVFSSFYFGNYFSRPVPVVESEVQDNVFDKDMVDRINDCRKMGGEAVIDGVVGNMPLVKCVK